DALWGDYLFMRQNPKGWLWEQWQHTAACRKVFVVKRHTASYEVAGSWTLAEGQALWLTEKTRATARDMDPRMQMNPQGATA
ncbi:sarcosine oxidase subunit delta, partial [Verminephrobacter eiseniae]